MDNKDIERSIIKKYRKLIWRRFVRGVEEYKLISDGDKIAVCISGGKDSFLLAKCMQELKKHGKINFDIEFIVMNPGYKEKNLNKIMDNSKILNIPIKIFNSDIFEVVNKISKDKPCYMCARMRRGYLYNKAKELGCNKIALGHHYDDVIETILLSMIYGAEIKTMMPKLHSTNFPGMELIRPLYLVKEEDIISWSKYNKLEFINCACSFTEKTKTTEDISKRLEMKKLISHFRNINKNIDQNIFKSVENINLDAVIGYKDDNGKYNFLDNYDKKD
ncbi:MAG: ATP-binding protein [bacterium]|nr:ATP-binding protein [bacterium]